MTLEAIFTVCTWIVMAGWLALILAPLARPHLINAARLIALVLCAAYLIQYFTITEPVANASFSKLSGVVALFSKAGNLMFGWTHYLAFDLFIGAWEAEDAHKNGIPHWILIPILFLTLMFGPMGLLLYFIVRTARLKFFKVA
jgi:Domain of unknown function (DUF4281)